MSFDYDEAFQCNLGLLTEEEQKRIKEFTIAIPGMGAVGSYNLISLVRQGFEKFKIADFDKYEVKNFNRQYGATMNTLGKQKATTMKQKALEINPDCKIEIFDDGITHANIDAFLDGVDFAVDGLDFFAFDIRRLFFNKALLLDIPVVTAGPIGFGTAFLIFLPDGPNFDQYFGIKEGMSYEEKIIAFGVGLCPKMLQRKYMRRLQVGEKKYGPSSIAGITLASGITTSYAIKVLLGKGKVKAVPYFHHFDAIVNRYVIGKVWGGAKNPIHRLKMKIAIKMLTGK